MDTKRCYGCMQPATSAPVCPQCGFPADRNNESHQLSVGTVLKDRYLVGRVLGQGGFGITYIGWDNLENTAVAIKEYYPASQVTRDTQLTNVVHCYTEEILPMYHTSKERFLREARSLARLQDVPAIVRVQECFELNDTAYIVMEYLRGTDLRGYMVKRGSNLSCKETLTILRPVVEALEAVHERGLVHRDISPDNIMLHPMRGAVLLDFGAARDVSNADVNTPLTKSTEAILKHGFAPLEQYRSRGSLGPWTDVYALCATIYYCLTGRIPPEALARMMGEEVLDWSSVSELTPQQRDVLEKGMAIMAKDRVRSMAELRAALYPAPVPVPEKESRAVVASERVPKKVPETPKEKPAKPVKEKPAKPVKEKPAKPVKEKPAKPVKEKPAKPVKEKPAKPATAKTAKKPSKLVPLLCAGAVLAALGAGGLLLLKGQEDSPSLRQDYETTEAVQPPSAQLATEATQETVPEIIGDSASETTVAPTETTVAPTEEITVPSEETTVPSEETTAPTETVPAPTTPAYKPITTNFQNMPYNMKSILVRSTGDFVNNPAECVWGKLPIDIQFPEELGFTPDAAKVSVQDFRGQPLSLDKYRFQFGWEGSHAQVHVPSGLPEGVYHIVFTKGKSSLNYMICVGSQGKYYPKSVPSSVKGAYLRHIESDLFLVNNGVELTMGPKADRTAIISASSLFRVTYPNGGTVPVPSVEGETADIRIYECYIWDDYTDPYVIMVGDYYLAYSESKGLYFTLQPNKDCNWRLTWN